MRLPYHIYIFSLPQASFTECLVLRPPEEMPISGNPRILLEYFDGKPWTGSAEEAAAELTRRIEERAASLPWPSLALVRKASGAFHAELRDALTWCTAASKQVGRIILLNKEPNLERLNGRKELVLHFPVRSEHQ
ncbi:MAG: hypothetical protein ACOYX1_04235 [Acidobacteriota bacterium]